MCGGGGDGGGGTRWQVAGLRGANWNWNLSVLGFEKGRQESKNSDFGKMVRQDRTKLFLSLLLLSPFVYFLILFCSFYLFKYKNKQTNK